MKLTILNKELMKKLFITDVTLTRVGTTATGKPIHSISVTFGDRNLPHAFRQVCHVMNENYKPGERIDSATKIELFIEAYVDDDKRGAFHNLPIELEGVDAQDLTDAISYASTDKETQTLLLIPYDVTAQEINSYDGASDGARGEELNEIWIAAAKDVAT